MTEEKFDSEELKRLKKEILKGFLKGDCLHCVGKHLEEKLEEHKNINKKKRN